MLRILKNDLCRFILLSADSHPMTFFLGDAISIIARGGQVSDHLRDVISIIARGAKGGFQERMGFVVLFSTPSILNMIAFSTVAYWLGFAGSCL